MTKLEYAFREGFVAIFYYPDKDSDTGSFNGELCRYNNSVSIKKIDGKPYMVIDKEKTLINDDFYIDNGILTNDSTEAANRCEEWKHNTVNGMLAVQDAEISHLFT